MEESISRIITELNKKKSSLDEASQKSYNHKYGYNTICQLLDNVVVTSPEKIAIEDVVRLSTDEISTILHIIGVDETKIEKIKLNYDPNRILFDSKPSSTIKQKELNDFFDEIRRYIINYVNSYKTLDNNVSEVFTTQRKMCDKCLRIFSIQENTEVLEPNIINEIDTFLINCGISPIDRANALGYINNKIINTIAIEKDSVSEADISIKISNISRKYLFNNDEYVMLVQDYVDNETIDIDSIPSIASDICNTTGLSLDKMINTLVAYIVGGLYNKYLDTKDEEILDNIESLLKYVKPDNQELLSNAKKIVKDNKELYIEALNNNENIDSYVDSLVSSLIEDKGLSLNEAIDKKCLPFIKSLSKLIEKMENLDPESNEYKEGLENINILIELYNEQQSKKREYIKNK